MTTVDEKRHLPFKLLLQLPPTVHREGIQDGEKQDTCLSYLMCIAKE